MLILRAHSVAYSQNHHLKCNLHLPHPKVGGRCTHMLSIHFLEYCCNQEEKGRNLGSHGEEVQQAYQKLLVLHSTSRCYRVPGGHDKLLVRHEGSFSNSPACAIKYVAKLHTERSSSIKPRPAKSYGVFNPAVSAESGPAKP